MVSVAMDQALPSSNGSNSSNSSLNNGEISGQSLNDFYIISNGSSIKTFDFRT